MLFLLCFSYQVICESVDKFVQDSNTLRLKLGLPEKELIVKRESKYVFLLY